MVVEITRGSRSEKYAAQDWICECGHLNKRKEFLIFDLPPFYCQNVNCLKVCTDVIYFNLADVEVNGRSILPSVKDQGNRPECISYALCQAQELNDVVESIFLNDYTCVEQLDPMVLVDTYSTMFHCMKDKSDKRKRGLHKFVHMAGILSDLGRATVKDEERASHSDVCAVTKWSFEDVCEYIADGRGVVAVFRAGDKLSDLKFGEVYCPPPHHATTAAHAVVLIGAIFYRSRTVYIFLNSWGKEFCAVCDANGDIMRDAEGEIMFGGIGLIENIFCWNPIVLSRSWEKGVCGRLSVSWGTDLTNDEIMCECQALFESKQRATFTIRDDSWAVVPSQFQEGNNNYLPGPYERNENDVEGKAIVLAHEDLERYVEAVDQLKGVTRFLDLSSHSKSSEGVLNRVDHLLTRAMMKIEDEFMQLMHTYSQPIEPDLLFDCLPKLLCTLNGAPEAVEEQPHQSSALYGNPTLIPPKLLPLLHNMAHQLVQEDNHQSCYRIYRDARVSALELTLRKLGVEELNKYDVQRMQWEALKSKIGNWNQIMQIVVKVLLAGEKQNCDLVFGSISFNKDQCFAEVAYISFMTLLNFGDAVAKCKMSPEKLPVLLDMYGVMHELHLEVEVIFQGRFCSEMREAALNLTNSLAQTAQDSLVDFVDVAEKDSKKPYPGWKCELHNYLSCSKSLFEDIILRGKNPHKYMKRSLEEVEKMVDEFFGGEQYGEETH